MYSECRQMIENPEGWWAECGEWSRRQRAAAHSSSSRVPNRPPRRRSPAARPTSGSAARLTDCASLLSVIFCYYTVLSIFHNSELYFNADHSEKIYSFWVYLICAKYWLVRNKRISVFIKGMESSVILEYHFPLNFSSFEADTYSVMEIELFFIN